MKFAAVLLVLVFVFVAIAVIAAMRGMIAGQRQSAAASQQWFERQRFAPAVTVIGAAVLAVLFNANLLQLLLTAQSPMSAKPTEGFSSSQNYWFNVAASALVALVIDVRIVRFFWRMRKNRKNA